MFLIFKKVFATSNLWKNVGTIYSENFDYCSLVLNKRTGTMKKNSPKFQAVPNVFCGTIESNSRFWDVVLLFQPLRVPLTSDLQVELSFSPLDLTF